MMRACMLHVALTVVIISLVAGCGKSRKGTEVSVPPTQPRAGEPTVDNAKNKALLESVSSQPVPQVVPIDRFFDGNNDLGSIGCNLTEHPGIERFRDILTGLLRRKDVEAVFAQISELDPGEGRWPFADTVLVVGTISAAELRTIIMPLQPDEIGTGEEYGSPSSFIAKYKSPVHAIWWD
jgi:hypothetical protein